MQVLVFVRFSALIHRNRAVLTTTTKLVYLYFLVNKKQPTQGAQPFFIDVRYQMSHVRHHREWTAKFARVTSTNLPYEQSGTKNALTAGALQGSANAAAS